MGAPQYLINMLNEMYDDLLSSNSRYDNFYFERIEDVLRGVWSDLKYNERWDGNWTTCNECDDNIYKSYQCNSICHRHGLEHLMFLCDKCLLWHTCKVCKKIFCDKGIKDTGMCDVCFDISISQEFFTIHKSD